MSVDDPPIVFREASLPYVLNDIFDPGVIKGRLTGGSVRKSDGITLCCHLSLVPFCDLCDVIEAERSVLELVIHVSSKETLLMSP